uniref:ANF_receptor domain-containing protein n=1 Tax=Angiostrongylus cantonensis TaxID=6313 RepID=A0A158PBK2_ANGCA
MVHTSAFCTLNLLLTQAFAQVSYTPYKAPTKTIVIGAFFVKDNPRLVSLVGYEECAGALMVAVDQIRTLHLLDDYDFNFIFRFDNCEEIRAVSQAIEFAVVHNVDAYFGPTCNTPAIATGVISSVYNLPHYIWGFTTANELANAQRFPTVIIMTPNYFTLSLTLLSVMDHFGWTEFAFVYSASEDQERCPVYFSDLKRAVYLHEEYSLSFSTMFRTDSEENVKEALNDLRNRARIIVLCSSTASTKRKFMLMASDMGMITDEYVYIITELGLAGYRSAERELNLNSKPTKIAMTRSTNWSYNVMSDGLSNFEKTNGTRLGVNKTAYIWEDQSVPPDGRDNDASKAFLRTFMLSEASNDAIGKATTDDIQSSAIYSNFSKNVQEKMKQAPFLCSTCDPEHGWKLGELAQQLYNALLIYATVVNRTISTTSSYRDGRRLFNNTAGVYQGLLSNITIARDGARIPEFSFFTLKRSDLQPLIVGHITTNTEGRNATYVSKVTNEQTTIWNGRATPKSVPDCGFKGCPPSVLVAYGGYIFSAIGIAILLVALTIIVISYAMRSRARERERLDALWRISFITLRKQNSFMSTVSEGKTSDLRNETDRMCYFYYGKNPLMAFKHQGILKLEGRIKEEFRKVGLHTTPLFGCSA